MGKFFFEFSANVEKIEMFEISKRIAVGQHKNGDHLCIAHLSLSVGRFGTMEREI